eukprot:4398029-Amphidinium_carterae.1
MKALHAPPPPLFGFSPSSRTLRGLPLLPSFLEPSASGMRPQRAMCGKASCGRGHLHVSTRCRLWRKLRECNLSVLK